MKELKHVGTILARTWTREESEKEKKSHKMDCKKLHHKFDETAAVALAVFAEESLINSLLPLARQHVSQCREIGHESPYHEDTTRFRGLFMRIWRGKSCCTRGREGQLG
jgi:hypothetical protein